MYQDQAERQGCRYASFSCHIRINHGLNYGLSVNCELGYIAALKWSVSACGHSAMAMIDHLWV